MKHSILGNIARLQIALDQFRKGLAQLKENNPNASYDSYIGYLLAVQLCELAVIQILRNHLPKAETALAEAISLAEQFDLAPSYSLEGSFQFTTTLKEIICALWEL